MKLLLSAATAVALTGCGSPARLAQERAAPVPLAPTTSPTTPPATTTDERPAAPDEREAQLVAKMLAQVEAVRRFKSKRPVPVRSLDRSALIAQVKRHVARELPPQALRNEGLALQLFGFVPSDFSYEEAEYGLLEEQLAGYYEPADGTMYMAADLGEDQAEATLAHELVHALQDQRWDLESRSKYRPGDGDRSQALSALAEGDATSAMFDVLLSRAHMAAAKSATDLPDAMFAEQMQAELSGPSMGKAPHIMRTSLVAPYVHGIMFVHALRRRGGWEAVDKAWDDPPATSEQILHVDKWLAREPAATVVAPPFTTLGPGWTPADEDTEGELGTRLAFEEWMTPETSAALSSGWAGDRGVLLTNGDRVAFAWRLKYDDPDSTSRAERALRQIIAALEKGSATKKTSGAPWCRERSELGPIAVARSGGEIEFVLGPAVVSKSPWRGAGDCALARRWISEISGPR